MKFTAAIGMDNQVAWPARISGTDCWPSLSARVNRHTNEATYYTGQVYKAKLEFGGLAVGTSQPSVTTVYDDQFQLGTPPPPPSLDHPQGMLRGPTIIDEYVYPQQYTPRQVRFASNHYQHDTLLRVTLTLTFALYELDNGTPVRLPATEDVTVTAFADVRVWNRGMRYKPKYATSGELWTTTHYNYINQLMLAGQSRLSDTGYAWPANELEFQTKSGAAGILADLIHVNGLFINTHGEANGQFGSTADGMHDSFG